jgi:membrane-bound lytic murein transglycosylase D
MLATSCASASKPSPVSGPSPRQQPLAADPVSSLVAQADAALRAGLAAADAGHLDRARTEFDRATDLLLSFPGGALADPRVAEAYRRTLETVQVREIEMLAAGDGFTETDTEPASIDEIGRLAVGESPTSPQTRAQAVAAVAAESIDLPIELNDAVLSCIDLYLGREREWFAAALARGHDHLPHIRQVFASEGIPQDLAYVALVESAFKANAYSRAKARGVWQFISATGKRYGLGIDWWVDERSDPDKATRAAARYLKDLHEMFGDWNLALAGYNAGEGKVLRAMRRYGTPDFWALRRTRGLRAETKNYVPLIHAAIVIAKAPERYGFMVDPDPVPESEPVSIAGAFDLRVIAECAGEPVETIRTLNPVLRRLATPADRTFALRVPLGRAEAVADCVRTLPPEKRVNFRKHVVRRGQSLASIARANGVSARDVAEANGIAPGKRLRRGTELIIPIPAHTRVATARHERGLDASEGRRVRHRIKPGDTLVSIAAQYGTTVRELRTWNRLRNTRIAAGSVLTIYTGSAQD